ncbi:hypothetical protein CP532_2999 [Ophiocordyceps camponoti-leonardi (nom. inval.)]|nr:hypothetical protein CP532_2999 [Ophiocordyceps camponoti-leonardi (nom. inval.)]
MASLMQQFTAFGTDIVGLERILRLIQATLLTLTSYPALLANGTKASPLRQLQWRLNLTRRTLRLFWFLGTFEATEARFGSDGYLGVLAQAALGVFGLVESVTLLDLVAVDGVAIWGVDEAWRLDREAQVLWLFGLCLDALTCALRLRSMSSSVDEDAPSVEEKEKEKEKKKKTEMTTKKKERKSPMPTDGNKKAELTSRLVADLLDALIPASSIGYVSIDDGLVGIAMVCSTLITATTVWSRCRRHLPEADKAA